jgi:integrase
MMPRTYEMSYEGAPYFRWVKMHKGVRYRVSCEELGAMVFTKEGSGRLANEWWRAKLASLNAPRADLEQQLADRAAELVKIDATIAAVKAAQELQERYALPAVHQAADEALRAVVSVPQAARPEQATKAQAERFLTLERLRITEPATFGDLQFNLTSLLTRGPVPEAAGDINEQTVTTVYVWLREDAAAAPSTQRKLLGYWQRFVRFLWEQRVIELPRNLDSYSMKVRPQAVRTYPAEQVREMLAALPERKRLFAFLALNCGMYSSDMGQLKKDEYRDGRITRRRTKTRNATGAPTVEYVLWPETRALLEAAMSNHPELCLTSRTGGPLWGTRIENGKLRRFDLIQSCWYGDSRRTNRKRPPIPLKALRSVSATLLESHPVYGRCTTLFLGHSPKTLKDRHYAAPPQALFDEALGWLRTQLLG